MTVEELAEQVKSLQKKVDDTTKETEGLQSLAGKWSGEVGEIRKQLAGAGGNDELKTKLDALESELKEIKSAPKGGQPEAEPEKPSERKSPEEVADELELSLNDSQRKLVEQIYNDLPDKSSWDDAKFRVAAYEKAKSVDSVPEGPWRAKKKEQPKPDDMKRLVDKLFDNARKKTRPPPGSGGVGAYGDVEAERPNKYDGRSNLAGFLKAPRLAG